MRNLPNYEQWLNESVNEGAIEWLKKMKGKSLEFAKSVWDGAKREGRETKEVVRLIQMVLKGDKISDSQKDFIKAQSVDIVKILPLVAIQGIPVPVPITPLLIMAGKKIGFDFLPNSHTKVNYQFEWLETEGDSLLEDWKSELSKDEVEMVKGIVEILLQIKDLENRKEVANTRIEDFKEEGIKMDTEVFLKMCGLKPEDLTESTVSWNNMMKSVKTGKSPWSLVVVDKQGKVIKQEIVSIRDAVPAHFESLRKQHPKTTIHIEDSEGKRLWSHVDEYEGDSTQLASDLFLATQTAGGTIAF